MHGKWTPLSAGVLDSGDVPGLNQAFDVLGELAQKRLGVGSVSALFPGHSFSPLNLARVSAAAPPMVPPPPLPAGACTRTDPTGATGSPPVRLADQPLVRAASHCRPSGSDRRRAQLVELHQRDPGDDERAAEDLRGARQLAEQQPGEQHREQHLAQPDERGELGAERAGGADAGGVGEHRGHQ